MTHRQPSYLSLLLCFLPCFVATSQADLRREAEPNDTLSTAVPVIPPATFGGTIGAAGDIDLYAVRAGAGQTIGADILARGFRAGAQPGSDLTAVLEILDTDATTVLASDQSAGVFDDPAVSFTVASSGRYFVSVRDLDPGAGGSSHIYLLAIELDDNNGFANATPIDPPVLPSVDLLIFPAGDQDFYRFEATAGQVVTIDIDSAVFNPSQPPAKIVATLFDPSRPREPISYASANCVALSGRPTPSTRSGSISDRRPATALSPRPARWFSSGR